ncbi:unnamed protein product [Amoebophrya sp. A25]|nr:unnamed protein product [Amoebophrya sp. A25]|eukprot:GSA25T00005425001.1
MEEKTAWLKEQRELLQLEQDEEKAETSELLKSARPLELASAGVALLKLYLGSGNQLGTGLYGKQTAAFTRYNSEDALPAHRLSSGDIVGIFDNGNPMHELKPVAEGIVHKVRPKEVEVIFSKITEDGTFPEHQGPYQIAGIASDITMSRYKYTLQDLERNFAAVGRHKIVDLCFQPGIVHRDAATRREFDLEPKYVDFDVSAAGAVSSATIKDAAFDLSGAVLEERQVGIHFRSPVTEKLNEPQQEAVRNALRSQDLHIIHGPPGTGKTTTCVAFILECVFRGQRLLVSAPSNVAVDNLLQRVAQHLPANQLVRIGHPVRVDIDLHKFTLDGRVAGTEQAALCRDIEREIREHLTAMRSGGKTAGSKAGKVRSAAGNAAGARNERYKRREEVSKLRKELKKRGADAVKSVLRSAQVVFCTCAGASEVRKRFSGSSASPDAVDGKEASSGAASARGGGESPFGAPLFDVALVDEAAQTLEVACWIPLLCGKRGVLAGDHNQLAATVKSHEATRRGLDRTLFGRMKEAFGDRVSSLLSIQYRMNETIMGWSSQEFYEGRLTAADDVRAQVLFPLQLKDVEGTRVNGSERDPPEHLGNQPLLFVDTAGNERCREQEPDLAGDGGKNQGSAQASSSSSGGKRRTRNPRLEQHGPRCNPGEGKLLITYVRWLRALFAASPERIKPSICVITPYNQQVDHLRLAFATAGFSDKDAVPVNTVDSYQGREADVVLLSLVRSNVEAEVGFLSDFRRLNVAVTRARKHVCIFGDSLTICSDEVLASLYQYALERGKVVFANEELVDRIDADSCSAGAGSDFASSKSSALIRDAVANPGLGIFELEKSDSAVGPSKQQMIRNKQSGNQASTGDLNKGVDDKASRFHPSTRSTTAKEKDGASMKGGVSGAQQPMHMSDAEIEKRRVKYQGVLNNFLTSTVPKTGQKHHDFPKGFNARERLIVHEICEKQGLKSESQGDGKKRFVRVSAPEDLIREFEAASSSKATEVKEVEQSGVSASSNDNSQAGVDGQQGALPSTASQSNAGPTKSSSSSSSSSSIHSESSQGQITGVADSANNDMLKKLAMEREAREKGRKEEAEAARLLERHKKLEAKKARKQDQKKATTGKTEDEENDFDTVLNEFVEKFPRGKCTTCRVSVKHLSEEFTTCEYCRRTYCFQHLQAECHGCGDAARKKERGDKAKRKELVAGDTTGFGAKLNDAQHRRAHNALSEKLKEAEKARSKKQS